MVPQAQTARERQLEELFPEYVAMGDNRSYGKLARKHQIEGPELMQHARAFRWAQRLAELQKAHNVQTATPEDDPGSSETNRRHLSRLLAMQKRAYDFLEQVVFDRPDTALKMLIECTKLEREIKGMDKNKQDDLASILKKHIEEASDKKAEDDFEYDPQLPEQALEEPTSPAPSGDGGLDGSPDSDK